MSLTKGSLQKKKKLRNFGHVAKFLDPPPLGRYGRKKFGRLEWGRTPPPPTVVWTFGQKKFVSRKSINKLMACLERVQWRYQNRERRGRGGQLLFYVLKQVECR